MPNIFYDENMLKTALGRVFSEEKLERNVLFIVIETGVIDNANLTFTSKDTAVATVGANTGVVTGVGAGEADIEIKVTAKPEIACYAEATVTA